MHATPDRICIAPAAHGAVAGGRTAAVKPRRREAGVSIVLAMLVLFVLVVVLFQVRFTASVEMDHARAFVDAARMGMLADAAFQQAQTQLLLDVDVPEDTSGGDSSGGGDTGGGGGLLGGLGDTGGGGGGGLGAAGDGSDPGAVDGGAGSDEQASIADTIANTDSLLDEWQESSALAPALGQDYTIFVEVEDEDSKINLLGLWNPDKEIADKQREIVRVLLDKAFEGTSRDLSYVDSTDILDKLDDWVAGNRGTFDPVPVPKLKKSNAEDEAVDGELDTPGLDTEAKHFPLTLGELADIEDITAERLVGFVEDDTFYPGLDRYLTLTSHLEVKPKPKTGDDLFGGSPFTQGSLFDKPTPGSGTKPAGNAADGGSGSGGTGAGDGTGSGSGDGTGDGTAEEEEVFDATNDGLVNANTAPLIVLRALAPEDIPISFLEKIIEYRREIIRMQVEGALDKTGGSLFGDSAASGSGGAGSSGSGGGTGGTGGTGADGTDTGKSSSGLGSGSGFGDTAEDEEITDFVFSTPDEVIDKVEQKYNFSLNLDPGIKTDFTSLLTTTSKVFTIKILILDQVQKRRASYRGTVWRQTGGEFPRMLTLLPLEPAYDPRRLKDFPEDMSDSSEDRFTYAAEKLQREQQGLVR